MTIENYKILQRSGSTHQVSMDRNGRKITKFMEIYATPAGKMSPEKWKDGLMAAVDQAGEGELLELIQKHCKENCVWLHTEKALFEYALEILAGRYFLCGSDAWKDVETEARSRGLIKESMSYADIQSSSRYQPPRKSEAREARVDIVQETEGQMRFEY